MYIPEHFQESRAEMMHRLIAEYPLGTLVTLGPDGIIANHIPFLLDTTSGPSGRLIGHVARNNTLWHQHDPDTEVLVVFQGASAYISPNWYATKQETRQVVPTYNYAVVHAYGPLLVHEDARWLRAVVGKLTKRMEMDQPTPWKMADAPSGYLNERLSEIVGIEIPVSRMIGKWKLSQNRAVSDRRGVVTGLRSTGSPADGEMADWVEETLHT